MVGFGIGFFCVIFGARTNFSPSELSQLWNVFEDLPPWELTYPFSKHFFNLDLLKVVGKVFPESWLNGDLPW